MLNKVNFNKEVKLKLKCIMANVPFGVHLDFGSREIYYYTIVL